MGISKLFHKIYRKVKPQTLDELKGELKVIDYQIEAGMAIAKANPGHDILWDNVHRQSEDRRRVLAQIKELEEI